MSGGQLAERAQDKQNDIRREVIQFQPEGDFSYGNGRADFGSRRSSLFQYFSYFIIVFGQMLAVGIAEDD
jgi:hypothetical protein